MYVLKQQEPARLGIGTKIRFLILIGLRIWEMILPSAEIDFVARVRVTQRSWFYNLETLKITAARKKATTL